MDKSKAKELIELHRRRWRLKGSDDSIALRAQRVYFAIAMMFVCLAASMSAALPKSRVLIIPGYFIAVTIACWASWRFKKIRKLLSDSGKTDLD